jgi:cytochrome d ubiquinol oxidase subunit I
LKVGWVYAGASIATLIIINGILTFMLTPGDTWISVAGTGHEASKFWNAFFNPTYWPSLLLRTGVCTSLAGIWALITSSRIDGDKQPALKTSMVKWSVKWLVPSFVATPFLLVWYLFMVPQAQRALLTLGIDTIGAGTFSTVTRIALIIITTSATIIGVAYFLAYRNPVEFNLSHALSVLLLALIATGSGEYAREMLRKPFVIGRWMYSNGVRVNYVGKFNSEGYLANSAWTWNGDKAGTSSYSRGEGIFRGQCASCHTLSGYRPLKTLLDGRDRTNINNFITMLHEYRQDSPYHRFMPPMVGTKQDINDLTDFLDAHVNPRAPVAQKPLLTARK